MCACVCVRVRKTAMSSGLTRVSVSVLRDELRQLELGSDLRTIGAPVTRAEEILTELIHRQEDDSNLMPAVKREHERAMFELIDWRARMRAVMGSRGNVRWLLAATEDFLRGAKLHQSRTSSVAQFLVTQATEIFEHIHRYDTPDSCSIFIGF